MAQNKRGAAGTAPFIRSRRLKSGRPRNLALGIMSKFEARQKRAQLAAFLGERLAGGGRFFHHGRVLLGDLVELVDGVADLRDALLLLVGGGADLGDQKRVMTPYDAIKAGSSHLVVARPIVRAEDPKAAARAILDDMLRASFPANQ